MEKKPHIALLLMCKNETKRLLVTLKSIVGIIDSIVAFDTGSTDDTIELLETFSKKHDIPLHLKQGEFIDFSTSRNESLKFADSFEEIDYLLLMDVNDELLGGDNLKQAAIAYIDKPNTGFLVCQEWFSGNRDKYYNIRFVKNRSGWRYIGRVHEYMKNTMFETDEDAPSVVRLKDDIILYQDRTQDDDKSLKRFTRDKILLLSDYNDNPTEPRTVFYLAQTCSCLDHHEDAFKYYKIRTSLVGFYEERFQANLRCGQLSEQLKYPWHESMIWYIKAFELIPRAEPLIYIAEHYREEKNWPFAFTFIHLACQLGYPTQCVLFVDKLAYDYKRWHLLGIIGFYAQFYKEGKIGCIKAIEYNGMYKALDEENLQHYLRKEQEMEKNTQQKPTLTKNQFLEIKTMELTKEFPNLSRKQIASKANKAWKDSR